VCAYAPPSPSPPPPRQKLYYRAHIINIITNSNAGRFTLYTLFAQSMSHILYNNIMRVNKKITLIQYRKWWTEVRCTYYLQQFGDVSVLQITQYRYIGALVHESTVGRHYVQTYITNYNTLVLYYTFSNKVSVAIN